MRKLQFVLTAAMLGIAACSRSSATERAADDPPSHVDSLIPRDEALRRFQAVLPRVDSLSGGQRNRDSLVARFITALEHRDTTALRQLLVDRSEFAYLYYPTTPQGLPPYDLEPNLLWFLLSSGSDKGLGRALEAHGGHHLAVTGYQCDSLPSREGENVVWGPCVVRHRQADGREADERLFGLILERDGRYKFVSYSNRL